ncbi:MAG: tetratricopeptide repeat protein [Desulfobacterales bacterium]|nr:tetratricopeptide repeat protein [Desulfobacterales bacterium]
MQVNRVVATFFIILALLPGAVAPAPADAAADGDAALKLYHQAISAKTIGERQKAFEKALEIYLTRFNRLKSRGEMNGLLCYNIGNIYFNLGQLGEAIFYYKTGLKLLPGNETILGNLEIALENRENPVDIESGDIKEILLFFHYKIGAALRIIILIVSCAAASLFLIALMLRPNTALKYLSAISLVAVFCLFVSIGVEYYLPQHQGVCLQTTDVRKGPETGFAPITPTPFGEGSSILVLSSNDGWFKVKLNDGRKGFVPKEHLKIVL